MKLNKMDQLKRKELEVKKKVKRERKSTTTTSKFSGRCMREKKNKMPMTDVKIVKMKSGMYAAKGKCAKCGCNMYKIIGKTKPEA